MALKKKEIIHESSAFVLPSIMTEMAAPAIDISIYEILPSPKDWNFFAPLPDGKFLELCDSISQHGLIHPLLIWEKSDGEMFVLSGHNRLRALKSLFSATGEEKYKNALCIVRNDLTEQQAQSLIIDANWTTRTLSPSEKAKCVARRYISHGRSEHGSGLRAYDKVAVHFGLKATQVYNYIRIAMLPDNILRKLDDGRLSIKEAVILSKLDHNQLESFKNDHNLKISTKKKFLTFSVPLNKVDEVTKAVKEILKK